MRRRNQLTGLRLGEIAALRIRDLNMRNGEVQVRRTMTYTSQGYTLDVPKTKRSVRDVPILDEALYRDLGTHIRHHPNRADLEASL